MCVTNEGERTRAQYEYPAKLRGRRRTKERSEMIDCRTWSEACSQSGIVFRPKGRSYSQLASTDSTFDLGSCCSCTVELFTRVSPSAKIPVEAEERERRGGQTISAASTHSEDCLFSRSFLLFSPCTLFRSTHSLLVPQQTGKTSKSERTRLPGGDSRTRTGFSLSLSLFIRSQPIHSLDCES